MRRRVFIVARDKLDLFESIRLDAFHDSEVVDVFLDRRVGERRQLPQLTESDRRVIDRRRVSIDAELAAFGYAVVELDEATRTDD